MAIQKGGKRDEGVSYFFFFSFFSSLRLRGVLKKKLKTYKVNKSLTNSLNRIKYESKYLNGNLPETAGNNNEQMIVCVRIVCTGKRITLVR